MIVGAAEIVVSPVATGFDEKLKAETRPGLAAVERDAAASGAAAGKNLRTGVTTEASKLESDLSGVGARGGSKLRAGVTGETGKLAGDMERDGARAGEGLSRGVTGGLSKLAGVLSSTGIPALGGFSSGLDKAAKTSESTSSRTSGLVGMLDKLGHVAVVGATVGLIGTGAAALDLGVKMQTADTAIANASGTSVKAATQIGNAFLDTKVAGEYSGQAMATAFAGVAGQLKQTQGHALDTKEAVQFMAGAGDLARASQVDLGTATAATASVMQAYGLKTKDTTGVTDTLYSTSRATGLSLDTLSQTLVRLRGKLGDSAGPLTGVTSLLIDMRNQGITGRASVTGVSNAMTSLEKTSNATQKAQSDVKSSFEQLSPRVQQLVTGYANGSISLNQYAAQVKNLAPNEATLLNTYSKSVTTLQQAQQAQKNLGVTVYDSQGKFVGMASVIDQLAPKFANMSHAQQIATASQIFGASAAAQMVSVIDAGPKAFQAAADTATKMGTAHQAAARQAQTLDVEFQTLKATASNIATQLGEILVPIVQKMGSAFITATQYVMNHKAILITLAAVVGGILTTAIAVFTVNKMAAFIQSFKTAGSNLTAFARTVGISTGETEDEVSGMVADSESELSFLSKSFESAAASIEASARAIVAALGTVDTAAEGVATSIGESMSTVETELTSAASAVGTDTATISAELESIGTAAATSAATVGTAIATTEGELTAAEPVLAAEATADGAAITAGLGPALAAIATIGSFLVNPSSAGETNWKGSDKVVPGSSGAASHSITGLAAAAGGNTGFTPQSYAVASLTGAGLPVTPSNVQAFLAWEQAEGGNWHNPDKYNPLGTTIGAPGAVTTNSAGVKSYTSLASGLQATIEMLTQTNMQGIYSAFGSGKASPQQIANAIASSPWGTKSFAAQSSGQYAAPTPAQLQALVQALNGNAAATQTHAATITHAKPGTGFYADPGTQQTQGQLPQLTAQLNALGQALGVKIVGLSGYRTPAHSVAVGGYANDPHTQGKAEDIGVNSQMRSSAAQLSDAELAKFGLYRPFPGAAEINHIQLLPGWKPTALSTWGAGTSPQAAGGYGTYTAGGLPTTSGPAAPPSDAALKAAEKHQAAVEKAALAAQKKIEQAQTEAAKKEAEDQKRAADQQVAEAKKQTAAAQKAQNDQTSAVKKEQAAQTQLHQTGVNLLDKMLEAIHSGSLKQLQGALQNVHKAGLAAIEKQLGAVHKDTMTGLENKLVATHKLALTELTKELVAAAKQAEIDRTIAMLTRSGTVATDTAAAHAQDIADATKVTLDQRAEQGLSGADLVAAQAQTHYDQIVRIMDQRVNAAQLTLDQAANQSPEARAAAQEGLDNAKAQQTVAVANAQSQLDLANNTAKTADAAQQTADAATAAADAASSAASAATAVSTVLPDVVAPLPDTATPTLDTSTPVDTTTTPTAAAAAAPIQPNYYISINGSGLTAPEVMSEIAWNLKVGNLPAAPAAVTG